MDAPQVRLYRNPWYGSLNEGVVLQVLVTAGVNAAERLEQLINSDEVEAGRDSYACVMLDPTCPRGINRISDLLFAAILIGPNAERYLPNAAAKADAHERHQIPNGELVEHANYCLGEEDFAYGNSAAYPPYDAQSEGPFELAIAGGSGLSVEQDGELALQILTDVMPAIHKRRDIWLEELRTGNSGHRWYNHGDEPGRSYVIAVNQPFATPITS